jgi:hypothetical protein
MMGESYEIQFPINVAGSEQLDQVDAAIGKIAGSASLSSAEMKAFEAILRSTTATGLTLSEALKSIAASQATLGAGFANTAKEMLREAEAAAAAGAAVGGLGSAHRKAVTDVQATGAAIRAFEGSLNIRAVEQFTSKVLGLGPAMQAIFPVVGAIAMVELLGTVVGKVVELYKEWDPVCQAEQRSLDILKETGKELDSLKKQEMSLVYSSIERSEGRAGLLRYKAGQQDTTAIRADQDVNLNEQRLADAQRRLAVGIKASRPSEGGMGSLSADAEAARVEIPAIQQQLEASRQRLAVARAQANEYRAQAAEQESDDAKRKAEEAKRAGAEARRAAEDAANKLAAYNSASEDAGLTPIQREIKKANSVGGDPRSVLFGADVMSTLGSGWSLGNAQSDAQRLHPGTSMGMVGRLAGPLNQVALDTTGDKDNASRLAGDTKAFQEGLKKTISDDDDAVKSLLDSLNRLDKISNEHAVRMLEIQLGDSEESIRTIEEKRLEGAKDEYDALKIVFETEEKIADLRKRQADELKQKAESLAQGMFSAFSNSRGAGAGMQEWLKGLGMSTAGTIFTNATTGPKGIFTDLVKELGGVGKASGLGDLLSGTLFDTKNAALDANTAALDTLTGALTGQTIRGADASVANGAASSGGILGSLRAMLGIKPSASSGGSTTIATYGDSGIPDVSMSGADELNYANASAGSPFGSFGNASSGSTANRYLGGAAAIAGGTFAAYDGFSRGGARGAIEGTGGIAGVASGALMLAGVSGPAAPILAGVGLALGAITEMFGDPRQNRANDIDKEIRNALYMAPPSVDVQSDITGARTRTNRAGQIDSTPWDAFAFQVNDPYYLTNSGSRKNEVVPGTVVYQYSFNVNAMDAKSVIDQRNNIATAVQQAMQESHPINYQVQAAVGPH